MRIRTIVVAAAFLAATLSSDVSAQTINGCVKNKGGALRVVAGPADCTPRETPISWNQTGPQGEPGIDGVNGLDGSDAEVLHVFDGLGQDLGAFAGGSGIHEFQVLQEDLGVTYRVNPRTGEHVPNSVTYTEPLCDGTAYVDAFMSNVVFPDPQSPNSLLIGSTTVYLPLDNHQSVARTDGSCDEQVASNAHVVAVEQFVGDLGISFPVPLPLYVGLPSE